MFVLRDYQSDLTKRASKAMARSGSVVVQLHTAAGKTYIAAQMCRSWVRKKMRVWIIAHRDELLGNVAEALDLAGVKYGPGTLIELKMIAAAVKDDGPAPDVLIFDESHHVPAASWGKVIARFPEALRLGLTATPGRLDGKPLSTYFAELVQGPSSRELRAGGYLADYRYFAPTVPDLAGVKIRKQEYDRGEVEALMTRAAIVGDVVEHYQRHAAGKRAILFAVSRKASEDMAARFNAAGIPARHVDGESGKETRAAAIAALRSGEVKVLCNVELFTEGFNVPAIECVILLRPTRSFAMCRQMLGRGLRPSKAKTVFLDHAGCAHEHGLPDEEYVWTLDGAPPRRKTEVEGGDRSRMRRCPECSSVHEWSAVCEECGHEYAAGREIDEVFGQLEEMRFSRKNPRAGYANRRQFANLIGVAAQSVTNAVGRGLPYVQGFIPIEEGLNWIRLNPIRVHKRPNFASSNDVSFAYFARLVGASVDSVKNWSKKPGFPLSAHGAIQKTEALEWIKNNPPRSGRAVSAASDRNTQQRRAFAEENGISSKELHSFINRGLPVAPNGYVIVGDAKRWLAEREVLPQSEGDLLTRSAFAKSIDRSRQLVDRMIKAGLPADELGRIHLGVGTEWVRKNWDFRDKHPSYEILGSCEAVSDFSKRTGIFRQTVLTFMREGMPSAKNGWVKIEPALKWIDENHPSCSTCPEGYEKQSDFSKRTGIRDSVISGLLRRGMPHIPGRNFVHIEPALLWVQNNYSPRKADQQRKKKRRVNGVPGRAQSSPAQPRQESPTA